MATAPSTPHAAAAMATGATQAPHSPGAPAPSATTTTGPASTPGTSAPTTPLKPTFADKAIGSLESLIGKATRNPGLQKTGSVRKSEGKAAALRERDAQAGRTEEGTTTMHTTEQQQSAGGGVQQQQGQQQGLEEVA